MMKFLVSIFLSALIPLTMAHANRSETLGTPPNVVFTPKIPADCYDGRMHKKLHAVNNIITTETDQDVVVNFRTYVLDCGYNEAREMTATFYGPLHAGRCDHTVAPYAGIRLMSFVEPLAPTAPYDKIDICNVTVNFDKRFLQAKGGSDYEYKYRHGALLEYGWRVAVDYDAATHTFSTNISQNQNLAPEPPVHHNLDREGPKHQCDEFTYQEFKRKGFRFWTVESPIAKINGKFLNLSFYVIGVSCMHDDKNEFGRPYIWGRDLLPRATSVVIRNSAHSPEQYDWNIYRQPITGPNSVDYLVTFNVPLFEVMDDDQIALFNEGEVAQVRFKVSMGLAGNENSRSGYSDLILNLDPKAP